MRIMELRDVMILAMLLHSWIFTWLLPAYNCFSEKEDFPRLG